MKKFDKTEELFSSNTKYASKHILNTCPNKKVSADILAQIERGVTLEELDGIAKTYDVFPYLTQITIHGIFPDTDGSRVFGYKNVFQNKNKSIGVRWNAIDTGKRLALFDILHCVGKWSYVHDSSNLYAYRIREYNEENVREFKEIAKRIDISLFHGRVNLYDACSLYGHYVVLELHIHAFYQKNMEAIITNILGVGMDEVKKCLDERNRRREEEEREWEKKRQERAEQEQKLYEKKKKVEERLVVEGWEYRKPVAGDIFLRCPTENSPYLFFYKARKYGNDIIIKPCSAKDVDGKIVCEPKEHASGSVHKVSDSIRYLCAPTEKKVSKEKPVLVSVNAPDNGIAIADYSERAFVVTGDTKPIKEILKSLGGRFNSRLTCGCGWVFPKTKREEVKQALKLA